MIDSDAGWRTEQRVRSNLESFRHHAEVWPEFAPTPKRIRKARGTPRLNGAELVEEAQWLVDNGALPWEVAKALGRTQHALSRMAYRRGLTRLGTVLLPEKSKAA